MYYKTDFFPKTIYDVGLTTIIMKWLTSSLDPLLPISLSLLRLTYTRPNSNLCDRYYIKEVFIITDESLKNNGNIYDIQLIEL